MASYTAKRRRWVAEEVGACILILAFLALAVMA